MLPISCDAGPPGWLMGWDGMGWGYAAHFLSLASITGMGMSVSISTRVWHRQIWTRSPKSVAYNGENPEGSIFCAFCLFLGLAT